MVPGRAVDGAGSKPYAGPMSNLGSWELVIVAVLLVVLVLEVAYWVIRLAVRSGVSDALKADRQWVDRRAHDGVPDGTTDGSTRHR